MAQSSMGLSVVVDAGVSHRSWRGAGGAGTSGSSRSRTTALGRRCGDASRRTFDGRSSARRRRVRADAGQRRGRRAARPGDPVRGKGPWLVTVFLSNEQEQVDRNKDGRWLFQAELELAADGDAAVFLGRDAVFDAAASRAGVGTSRGRTARPAVPRRRRVRRRSWRRHRGRGHRRDDPRRAVRGRDRRDPAVTRSGDRGSASRTRCRSSPGSSRT